MSVLVVIAGPIAAGKTTVARALAGRLRDGGSTVALVELDGVAAMSARADWSAALVGQWARTSTDVVIAEGPGSREEVDAVTAVRPAGTRTVVCVIESALEVALDRVRLDPTRGISRDPQFLTREYERWREESRMSADVRIDTGTGSLDEAVALITRALGGAGTVDRREEDPGDRYPQDALGPSSDTRTTS